MAAESEERIAGAALEALADAARTLATASTLREAATAIVEAVGVAVGADAVVGRVADGRGEQLWACAVFASSRSLAAQLEGSRVAAADLPGAEVGDPARLPAAVRRAAERAGLDAVALVPVRFEGSPVASLELLRRRDPFVQHELQLARVAAHQLALASKSLGKGGAHVSANGVLALAGEALVAGLDATRAPEHVVRLAVAATGATSALLWRVAGADPELTAAYGADAASGELGAAAEAAAAALAGPAAVTVEEGEFPDGAAASVTLQLGQPVIGALQLLFAGGRVPAGADLAGLATFGVRAAHVLRASSNARALEVELERTRTLLDVIGVATEQLSLQHTLETTLEKTAELLDCDRLAIYLRVDGRLLPAKGQQVDGPHLAVAAHLLELLEGPFRARTVVAIEDVGAEPLLAPVADAARDAGIEASVAVPLLVRERETGLAATGLLAVYPPRGRTVTANESALLSALAGQLAVAVQNAQLHEQAKQQEEDLKAALAEARRVAGELGAFYAISQSFGETEQPLDRTLEAVAETVVSVVRVDAAVISMPDERRELLVPRALHVADERLADAAHTILFRPQRLAGRRVGRLLLDRRPILLDAAAGRRLGREYALLGPFLAKGWTGAVVPIHTPTEVVAVLSFFSMHPEWPVTEASLAGAERIAAHAAVAIDRARLYQQQKEFADTMQRSLLPRARPQVPGLDLGAAYAASARVDVGGDVYDFLELSDGRLAVVLGDVTGHGIDATADMAMAKFVFRSLAREHPEPADFLAAANEVVVGEIASGKFITMLYLAVDGVTGSLACAGAGHPPPRLVQADGALRPLDARGLILGVAEGQRYDEVHEHLPAGASVVLYTDGVVEARRGGQFFGTERLDELLAARHRLPAQELADIVLEECRLFAGGEFSDDCAVVVVRRV